MNNKAIQLPCRLAYTNERNAKGVPVTTVLRGAPNSHGDAGWSVIKCDSLEDARAIMKSYPGARMPCWARFESGEVQ